MQLKLFVLPIKNLGAAEAEMNAFLRGHRVLAKGNCPRGQFSRPSARPPLGPRRNGEQIVQFGEDID